MRVILAAALESPDPVVRAHARNRLAAAEDAARAPAVAEPSRPVAESLRLMRAARACPYRSTSSTCGCVRCGLRGGAAVAVADCWACVETYGVG